MVDEVDYVFHAARLLENPAWKKAVADLRATLAHERDALAWDDGRRAYVSVAESLVTKLERRIAGMANANQIEQFNREQVRRAV